MKFDIDMEWCIRMAHHEGNTSVAAGTLARDPVFDSKSGANIDVADIQKPDNCDSHEKPAESVN